MGLELELKFLIDAIDETEIEALLAVAAEITQQQQQQLLNAYFDTENQWFRCHDMGLRTRQNKQGFEQTIKLAGQQHGALQMRPEFNLPCQGVVPVLAAFPTTIWPANTELEQLQSQLVELFRTDFNRQSWQLATTKAQIEVVYDRGEVRSGERRQPISEVELELLNGDPLELFRLAEFLLQALPLRAGWLSKAARGYQLYRQSTTPLPVALEQSAPAALSLLQRMQRLQQFECCYQQQLEPRLLAEMAIELAQITALLQDDGEQLLASQGRALQRQLQDQQVLVLGSRAYQLFLLKLSALLLQRESGAC